MTVPLHRCPTHRQQHRSKQKGDPSGDQQQPINASEKKKDSKGVSKSHRGTCGCGHDNLWGDGRVRIKAPTLINITAVMMSTGDAAFKNHKNSQLADMVVTASILARALIAR